MIFNVSFGYDSPKLASQDMNVSSFGYPGASTGWFIAHGFFAAGHLPVRVFQQTIVTSGYTQALLFKSVSKEVL